MSAVTPRSERTIRLAPCSMASQACSMIDCNADAIPAARSATGKSIWSVSVVKPRQFVELLEPRQLVVIQDRHLERDLPAVLRAGVEQVSLGAGAGEYRGHQLFADGIQRGVGHLGEELLEVVEEGLGAGRRARPAAYRFPSTRSPLRRLSPIGPTIYLRSSIV